MKGLIKGDGLVRSKNVGMLLGHQVGHASPQPAFVPELVRAHFDWLGQDADTPLIIISCISTASTILRYIRYDDFLPQTSGSTNSFFSPYGAGVLE